MIPFLAPIFEGPLAPYGEGLRLSPRPPAAAVRLDRLFREPGLLACAIERCAASRNHQGKDLRAVASAWSLVYLAKLLPPYCAAASVFRWPLPIDLSATWLEPNGQGLPAAFHIRSLGEAAGGTEHHRVAML